MTKTKKFKLFLLGKLTIRKTPLGVVLGVFSLLTGFFVISGLAPWV